MDISVFDVKRTAVRILVAVLGMALLTLPGCRKYEQIRVISGKVESVSLNGFGAVDVTLLVGVDNPAGKVIVRNAEGTVKRFGKIIGKVALVPFELMPRTMADYSVKAHVELAIGVRLKDIMALMSPSGLEDCLVDIEMSGTVSGVTVKRRFSDVPLKKLLENKINEKV